MLLAMRKKMHGWPSIVLLGVSVFAMSMFGMESYFRAQDDAFIAKVGKHEIDQRAYQDRVNQLRQQQAEQQGEAFDSSEFEKMETKLRIVDSMIDEQLLLQANADWGLRVSALAMRDYIASIPAFQVNGKFDGTSYRAWLTSQYKTPETFENEIRSSLAVQLLPTAISQSTIVSDTQLDQFLKLMSQRRDLRYFQLPRPTLENNDVSDAEIDAWYKAHVADYMNPEEVSVKYVEVNGADLPLAAEPSDEELKARYENEKQRFVQPEQRLASHILIDVPANATPEQQKEALNKAQKIAAEANPGNFAELAEKDSQDLGSRRLGGDLGWLEQGVTNEAFDSAMFDLDKGEISKPVLSSDGYHIIWVRDIRSGESKPFEEVRDQLVQEVTSSERDRTYNEVAGKMSDNTYQNPTSLEPASVALDVPIKSTGLFSRDGGEGIAGNPKVVAAAFSDDVLVQGNNSPLIELGNNRSLVLHVDKHVPASAKPLDEVRDDVRQKILDERVAAVEKKQADDALARLIKGDAMDEVAESLGASVVTVDEAIRQSPVPPPLLTKAFLMPHPDAGKSQFASVDMLDGTYGLLAVDKVQDGDISKVSAEERDALRQQMAQAYGYEATRELVDQLKSKAKIKINKQRL